MSDPLLKRAVDAVWPEGSAWTQKRGGGMEGLLLGVSDALEDVRAKLATLAYIRDPELTEQLDELEIDFGISPDPTLTDAVRRSRLSARINSVQPAGPRGRMERELQAAGFDLFVYSNDPAVDPRQFATLYETVAGGVDAFAGEPGAVAGFFSAGLLVNGRFVRTTPIFRTVAGNSDAFAGEPGAVAEIVDSRELTFEYDVPADPADWPLIFFVGGPATFGGSGELVSIELADVPASRMAELERTILRLKPMHAWAIMVVQYV